MMNIGIAGSGMIVPDFLEAAAKVNDFNIVAICGRTQSKTKLENIALTHGILNIYYEYEKMLENNDINVIYVAMPNNFHYEYAKKALLAGKNVILEKPFASTYTQAEELVSIAKQNKLYLFEAITNQYLPNYKKVKDILHELGPIRIVQMNFSQYSSRYDKFKQGEIAPVFNKEMGGGALGDLNIYNIYFIVGLWGSPLSVKYYPNIQDEIDTSGILIMEYPDFKCTAIGAKDCRASASISIQGEDGYISSDDTPNSFNRFSVILKDRPLEEFELNNNMPRLYYELLEFKNMVEQREYEKNIKQMDLSLKIMKILDEAKK